MTGWDDFQLRFEGSGDNKTDYSASDFVFIAAMFRCIRRCQVPRRHKPRHRTSGFSSLPVNHVCMVSARPNFVRNHPEDDDRALTALFEPTSTQHIFDTFTSIPNEDLSVRHSSQALAALWDIQKSMFTRNHIFNPSQTFQFKNQLNYVTTLRDHPVLQEIVRHVSDHRSEVDDEPLAVSLLCLKKHQFGMRSEPAQKIIGELLRRKTSLSLPALSRVFVCMRHESIYGFTVMSEFLPLLYSKVGTMSTDLDFRLVSSALRNCATCSTMAIKCKYLERLNEVLNENSIVFEVSTLCKIIAFLYEISLLYVKVPEKDSTCETTILASDLNRKVCNLLGPRVCEMDTVNVLSVSKFVDFIYEPVNFVSAFSKRVIELAERDRRLDLMSTIHPKTSAEENELSQFLHDFLDTCTYFEYVHFLVFRLLKKIKYDHVLHYKYWSKVTELLVNQDSKSEVEGIFRDYFVEDPAIDFIYEGLVISSDPFLKRKIPVFAHEYIYFRRGSRRNFFHREFEQTMTSLILQFFQDYDNGKIILVPKDYTKCFAFLLSIGYENLEIRKSFLPNLRIEDLILIQKGAELSCRNNTSVLNVLSKQAESMSSPNLSALKCIGLAKLNLRLQTCFEFHPIFATCMTIAASDALLNNSRIAKEHLTLMFSSGFYLPAALERVSKIIDEFPNDVPVRLVSRFLWACFIFGVEDIKGIEESARIISRNSHEMRPLFLLESALALCFQGCLDRETVAKIFCVEYLDEVDRYIKAIHYISRIPRTLRDIFMELNRAVCLEMPEANVPWFHEKYCAEVAAIEGYHRDTCLHSEVAQVLENVLGNGYFARRTYSPYFYPIDFLLELNEFGRPVEISSKPGEEKLGGVRIAIIVHTPTDFSSNQRTLMGRHVLMKRHLEIMEYRVINIDPKKWNSIISKPLLQPNSLNNDNSIEEA
ncbi:unnamed protein product [Allacma fusca]|uniref:Uncharacterized protein n=1 Tax=Allacma fusca TaxID=39272 RepID=A0A8J2JVN5_9HEXA|nr:unnamed protein product [Allacma fusca]